MKGNRYWLMALAPALLGACAIGPDYKRPEMALPTAYKEQGDWKLAEPKDDLVRGQWWLAFGDEDLNALVAQIEISNQNLRLAEAKFRQANAATRGARAGFFPTLAVSASNSHARVPTRNGQAVDIAATYTSSLSASWELDVWGRVRRQVESSDASAAASAADLEAVRLSLQAELITNYIQLRVTDAQKALFDDTVQAYERSLELTRNRYNVGVAAKSDVVQAEAQLKSTVAQAIDLGVQRAQLEHAIALLVGKAPADFSLTPVPFNLVSLTPARFKLQMPAMPLVIPSTLLERRPDIAAAERRMVAANAQIGVARAAYFPTLSLSASDGFTSPSLAKWVSAPNGFWNYGPSLALTLLDFGKRGSVSDQAAAAYDQTVASYRQTVLEGLQEVEDNLAALRILEKEAVVQEDAVRAARESVALTTNQYKAGTVSYLNVVAVQASQLSNERTAVNLLGRRLGAAVGLIRALGGGWNAAELTAQK